MIKTAQRAAAGIQEVGNMAREVVTNPTLKGVSVTTLAQGASAWLVSHLYNGPPERQNLLEAQAVFTAPVAYGVGRGLRKLCELSKIKPRQAEWIVMVGGALGGMVGARAIAPVVQAEGVDNPVEFAQNVGQSTRDAVIGTSDTYFDTAAVSVPSGVVAGKAAMIGAEQKSSRR